MDQRDDKETRPQEPEASAPEDHEQAEDKRPEGAGEPPVREENAPQEEHGEEEPPQERHFRIGVRETIAAVIGGVILIVIGIVVFHNGSGPVVPQPPKLPRIPPTQQAKDRDVPNAKSPVQEKVWAPEATTFSNPFKLEGTGQPIPHNEIVLVSCKLYWPHPESVEEEGFWYRIVTKPWKSYFSPANSFWNGDKPGEKPTHSTDYKVRNCHEGELPDG